MDDEFNNPSQFDLFDDSSDDEFSDSDSDQSDEELLDSPQLNEAMLVGLLGRMLLTGMSQTSARPTATIDTLCSRVRESIRDLRQLRCADMSASSRLSTIYQVYVELHNTNKDGIGKIGDILIEEHILDIFVRFWDECHEDFLSFYSQHEAPLFQNFLKMKGILWNYSDGCPKFASEFYRKGVAIERLMREFSMPQLDVSLLNQQHLHTIVMSNLSILHNVVRHDIRNKDHIRRYNGIEKILAYQNSSDKFIKTVACIVLAYCIDEHENSKIVAGSGVITFLLKILKGAVEAPNHQDSGFHADETVSALNKLAQNDENKNAIVEAGALPAVAKLLKDDASTDAEQVECVKFLWRLSFQEDNKKKIKEEPGLMDRVKSLKQNEISDALKKEIAGLLFELTPDRPVQRQSSNNDKHVMISYNWDVKPVMIKLKEYLASKGIKTWMDVDDMHGPIEDAMANAVENASLIVIALSEKYKNSNSCRSEGLYAHRRKVPIVPLILQPGYDANGWLGLIIASGKWVDLSSADHEQNFPQVLEEIRCLMKTTEADGIQASTSAENTVRVSLKFSDRSRKYEGVYKLEETVYDMIADIRENTKKNVVDIQHSTTRKIVDEDLTIEALRKNGYLSSLTAMIE